MKKLYFFALVALACSIIACSSKSFKKTDNGLLYCFENTVSDGQQPQVGDLLVGELVLTIDGDTLFSNLGKPDRIFQVAERTLFAGDIQEGLLMMHVGETAIFKVSADSIANFMGPNQMPSQYKAGEGQYMQYRISLHDIVTKEELVQEQNNFIAQMEQRQKDEPDAIAQYIAEKGIIVKPSQTGVYIIVNKKGTGAKVAPGKIVAINYTGRTIEGKMFDTSREADAKEGGIYMSGREYSPLTYTVGAQPLIKGWEEGVQGQPAGTELTLVIPSEMAYGARGAGNDIQPYTPLVFDLTIESVE